jgi:predicted ATPase with chaperone activity
MALVSGRNHREEMAMLGISPLLAEADQAAEALPPASESTAEAMPIEPSTLKAAGLDADLVIDLILKMIYQRGPQTGYQLADRLRLSLATIQDLLAEQRHLHMLEVLGSDNSSYGDGAYIYQLTEKGGGRAQKALTKSGYVGPAPVPFEEYAASVLRQSIRNLRVDEKQLTSNLSDLVINPRTLAEVGPALNSTSSIFFYGAPGNGKTSIASRIVRLLGGPIFVPHAINLEGSIMEFFDPVAHIPVPFAERRFDRRWVKVERPAVVAGGELTAESLDVYFNEQRKTYQPAMQMKANCGMFFVDDFGRQTINPHQLLNRLIVPLEHKVDYITLVTGTKLEVPFDEIVVFSTNLQPAELADEAFLRRIKYKIHLEDPTLAEFREIFLRTCRTFNVEFEEAGFQHLVTTHYQKTGRSFRAVHPRDLLDQVQALCRYRDIRPAMNPELLDLVVRTYFAD